MRLDPRQRLVAEKAKPRRIDVAVNGAPTSLETGRASGRRHDRQLIATLGGALLGRVGRSVVAQSA